jgi:O-antigen/teichoic acid export membrane protein
MDERAIRGLGWTMGTYVSNKLLTVGTMVALARLLSPGDFGLFALATVAIGLFLPLRDLGLGPMLVSRPDLTRRAQGTTLTLIALAGTAVAVLVALVSPLLAAALHDDRVTAVVIALGSTLIVGVVGGFYDSVLQRELMFKRRFVGQTIYNLTYAPIAIGLAAATDVGVWSLVIGHMSATITSSIAYMILSPYRVRPRLDRADARDQIGSSKGFLAQATFTFVQANVDYITVGRVLGATQLGYYSLAYRLAELPYQSVSEPVAKVTFPAFAQMRHRGEDVGSVFLRTVRLVAVVTALMGVVLSGAAEPFVNAVLGEKWDPMVGALTVLGLLAVSHAIYGTYGWMLNAVGRAGFVGTVSGVILIPLVPALVLAANHGGITAVAWAMLAGSLGTLAACVVTLARREGVHLRDQWASLRPVIVAGPVTWLVTEVVGDRTSSAPAGVSLAAAVAAGVATYLVALALVSPDVYGEGRQLIARVLSRARPEPVAAP